MRWMEGFGVEVEREVKVKEIRVVWSKRKRGQADEPRFAAR